MWKRALLTCGLCLLLAGCGEFVAGGSGADFTGDDFHGGKILASEDWE